MNLEALLNPNIILMMMLSGFLITALVLYGVFLILSRLIQEIPEALSPITQAIERLTRSVSALKQTVEKGFSTQSQHLVELEERVEKVEEKLS